MLTSTIDETLTLPGGPHDVAEVRGSVRRLLAAPTYDRCRDDVVLALSELVTNAIVHAGGPVQVRIRAGRSSVRLEVADPSPAQPAVVRATLDQEGGRGLHLVSMVAKGWGVEAAPDDGKTVWAELAV